MIFFCSFPDVFIAKDKYWMCLSKRPLCIKSFMARWIMFLSAPWPHLQKRFTNKFNRTSVLTECQSNSPLNCEVEVEEVPKAHALSQLIICNWKKLNVYFRETENDAAVVALLRRGSKTMVLTDSCSLTVTICHVPLQGKEITFWNTSAKYWPPHFLRVFIG